ncbi:HEAT repeat protein-like protein [Paraphoma chrysanthemicola]|nr:HEAT repeat protein-like protein [Paraphoma chrysanthemicola]
MERQKIFQSLKQPCIQVLQVTAGLAQKPELRKDLVTALANLLSALKIATSKPDSLDSKLAEYAFVPISQVLRLSRQVPVHALELCLECISVLLRAGWGGGLEPALSGQLLILFTFLAKPSSAQSGITGTSEELQALAFKCMAELLAEASRTTQGRDAITGTSNIPALGEAVLVMLDGLTDSKSNGTRLQSLLALKAVIDSIEDDDALASFLPRMVSSLTKVLTPASSNRPGFRVVEQSLLVLSALISRLLSDAKTKGLPQVAATSASSNSTKVARSTSWLHATASQIKIALANIFKLRNHDKTEVRLALLRLCLLIVRECRTSLSECTGMAIETAISLVGRGDSHDIAESELKTMLSVDNTLSDLLRESLHGWVVSLPRVMQSKDDHARRQIIHQISVTLRLFDQDPTLIDERLADSLRDGISAVLTDSKGLEELTDQPPTQAMVLSSSSAVEFQPLQLRLKGQDDILNEFRHLIQELAKANSALIVLQALTRTVDMGTQESRLASFWVSVNLLKDVGSTNLAFDDFIDTGMPSMREELLDDLYAQSVTVLTQQGPGGHVSWQFYALALETVALQASRYKSEFRPELSEVLYPVLHYLGDANDTLREHALVCLNILSKECGYGNAGELVVSNVDYIVNAVGLKLAIGDVSPQAPQVLLMTMRLCGPSLLPYLDDLVGSIFDALERYHGYPKLTELLFSVLKGMTEEGVKAPQLAITDGSKAEANAHKREITMADVVEALRRLNEQAQKRKEEDENYANEPFPQKPWKEDSTPPSDSQNPQPDDQQALSETQTEDPPPPAPRTFSLLLKISQLTQHYLTTSSPSLRTSLLSLLGTTIPALAQHENSFLPLINTLWPVLLPRLHDPEAYVVSNALDIIALMCTHAGDFMRSRIEASWDVLKGLENRAKIRGEHHGPTGPRGFNMALKPTATSSASLKGMQTIQTGLESVSLSSTAPTTYRPELYTSAPSRMIWTSLVKLFCAIAQHVAIRDDMFDNMLIVLDPVLEREDVKSAMEMYDKDAVWLRIYKKRKVVEGMGIKRPVGRAEWQFVVV